jgi:hypothetical protein
MASRNYLPFANSREDKGSERDNQTFRMVGDANVIEVSNHSRLFCEYFST